MTEQDFWNKVDVSGSCWVWQGAKNNKGYGRTRWGRKFVYAHRLAYHFHNDFPVDYDGKNQINHLCRNRLCVNPKHLEVVSNRENTIKGKTSMLNGKKTSRYPGVYWDKRKKKWHVYFRVNGNVRRHIGRFDDELEAAKAYQKAVGEIR